MFPFGSLAEPIRPPFSFPTVPRLWPLVHKNWFLNFDGLYRDQAVAIQPLSIGFRGF